MTYPNKRDCEHGQLRGSCNTCDYEKEIQNLKGLLQRCRDAISEAGYEDYDMSLMEDLDKAI
jgi:hypothetical protein